METCGPPTLPLPNRSAARLRASGWWRTRPGYGTRRMCRRSASRTNSGRRDRSWDVADGVCDASRRRGTLRAIRRFDPSHPGVRGTWRSANTLNRVDRPSKGCPSRRPWHGRRTWLLRDRSNRPVPKVSGTSRSRGAHANSDVGRSPHHVNRTWRGLRRAGPIHRPSPPQ